MTIAEQKTMTRNLLPPHAIQWPLNSSTKMMPRAQSKTYTCARCLRSRKSQLARPTTTILSSRRTYSADPKPTISKSSPEPSDGKSTEPTKDETQPERGALSRRLEEATEEALLTGGRAGRRVIEEAGFSEELKEKLYDKVAAAKFQSKYAGALAQAGLPPSVGEGTRVHASAEPWRGEESQHDTLLRMLDDARKPLKPELRGKFRPPDPRQAQQVDLRIKREGAVSAGKRAASARERAEAYVGLGLGKKDGDSGGGDGTGAGLSEEEREAVRREFKERFRPGARSVSSISGIAALANERIEDAIARGQFKNIPRGPSVERDTRADNPFIDTTEYIMNKMIKRQEIVPPWIEKQQQVLKDLRSFRSRLRNDWLRHAARAIASQGGTLEEQVRRAEAYAQAEAAANPRRRNVDEIPVPSSATDDPVMAKVRQPAQVTTCASPSMPEEHTLSQPSPKAEMFRDPAWEAAEHKYMTLAIENLNSMTRSYNLMAPELAKKPYFSLKRELEACYADVAPRVAEEIRNRATARPARSLADGMFGGVGGREGVSGGRVRVHESKTPYYGFKEMWREWWGKTP